MKQWFSQIVATPLATAKNAANAIKESGSSRYPSAAPVPAEKKGKGYEDDQLLSHLLRHVRSKAVRRQFFCEIDPKEYVETKPINVMTGTYNVNGRKPPPGLQLSEWLGDLLQQWPASAAGLEHSCSADIVAIGFQEVVPLNAGNVIAGGAADGAYAWDRALAIALNGNAWAAKRYPSAHTDTAPSTEQAASLIDALDTQWSSSPTHPSARAPAPSSTISSAPAPSAAPPTPPNEPSTAAAAPAPTPQPDSDAAGGEEGAYVQVAAKQMVGVYLTVWAKRSLVDHIGGVQTTTVATGFGGYLGNKGAVAVRMRVHDSPLCLVAAHLSSGAGEGDELKRNSDYSEIVRRGAFPLQTESVDPRTLLRAALQPGHWGESRGLLEQENAIWVGDLNYRLNLPDEDVRRHLRTGALPPLLAADQLRREMAAGRAFAGWHEAPLTFPPTFKYRLGSTHYLGDDPAPAPPAAAAAAAAHAAEDAGSGSDAASTRSASPGPRDAAPPPAAAPAAAAGGQPGAGGAGAGAAAPPPPPSPSPAVPAAAAAAAAAMAGVRAVGPLEAGLARLGTTAPGAAGAGGAAAAAAAAEEGQKRRTPAWCDRILWRSSGGELEVVAYERGELTASDHRPVSAAFVLKARHYNREKVQQQLDSARRQVDLLEMARRPKVHLETNTIDAGQLGYRTPRTAALRFHNTSAVDAPFYFMPMPSSPSKGLRPAHEAEDPLFPPWLTVAPDEGLLPAGSHIDLQLRLEVTGGPSGSADRVATQAKAPAGAPCPMETILILRVDGAGDMFAHVSATYHPVSVFGRSLEALPAGDPPSGRVPHLGSGVGVGAAGAEGGDSPPPSPGAEQAAALLQVLPEFRELEEAVPQVIKMLVWRLATPGCLQTKGIFSDSPRLATSHWAAANPTHPLLTSTPSAAPAGPTPSDPFQAGATHAAGGLAESGSVAETHSLVEQLFHSSHPSPQQRLPLLLEATADIRAALDGDGPLPTPCSPHALAATLLALCAELPRPLVPASVVEEIQTCLLPPAAVAALLAEALPPLHWAVLRLLLRLVRAALQPPFSQRNLLSLTSLSATLATFWLPPLPPALHGSTAVVQQRQQLVALLLEPDLELVGHAKRVVRERSGQEAASLI